MKADERKEYIRYRLEKAKETLAVADLLIENKKWNSAVNRLYYAAYYAVSALLIQSNITAKTHVGIKTQFFQYYIKTKKIPLSYGRLYSDLFDWRQKGDYGDFFDFKEKDVIRIIQPVKDLVKVVVAEIIL